MFDAQLYRDKAEVEAWRKKGPIARFRGWLEANHMIHAEDEARIEAEIAAEIDDGGGFRRGRNMGAGRGSHALRVCGKVPLSGHLRCRNAKPRPKCWS